MRVLQFLILWIVSVGCVAAMEYKKFDDPNKEQVYNTLIDELRCLVCQNQTIADSNADLAKDLRRQVYEMLQQDKSQDEIVDYMTQRYGDFVMYSPPFKTKTGLLWIGPILFLLIGIVLMLLLSKRKKSVEISDINDHPSDEEKAKQAKVKSLLNKGEQS